MCDLSETIKIGELEVLLCEDKDGLFWQCWKGDKCVRESSGDFATVAALTEDSVAFAIKAS